MRILPVLLIVCLAVVFAAGCISEPAETKDPIVGSWTAYNHTTILGQHYTRVVDTFYENYTGIEASLLDDGTEVVWETMWMHDGDSSYISYYEPFRFVVSKSGVSGVLNAGTIVTDWVLKRVNGTKGFVGDWELTGFHSFMGIPIESGYISADTDGNSIFNLVFYGGISLDLPMKWTEIGDGMFVNTMSQTMEWTLGEDGKLRDNFNLTYTRVE